jgi:integrase
MADLSRKTNRTRLKIRREPYWQRLTSGAYLGFRRGPDTWIARYRNRDGKQTYQALAGAIEYDDAKRQAELWLKQLGSTAVRSVRRGTVRDALETYLKWLREQGREATADTSEQRFELIVWPDPLADTLLQSLSRDDMRDWRERLRPGRQPRSINRHVRSIVAGLNRAHSEGYIGNPESWKLPPLADDTDDAGETAVLLSPEQRRAIHAACCPAAALFVRGLELTGARPKEIAAATVRDFDPKHGTLRLAHRKGRPAKLRVRSVVLSVEAIAFFKAQTKGKLPTALLFLDPFGNPWTRHSWAREVRDAINAHNAKARGKKRIPKDASAYSFRHSRISELLQVYGLDPLTVAAQTGTSIKMLEKAYFRMIPAAMREKLAAISEGS